MKKIFGQFRKGQTLVEFIIVGALVSIAAIVFLSPLASNIKGKFLACAPQKVSNVSVNSNSTLSTLSVADAINIMTLIGSNNADKISDENLFKVVNSLEQKKNENNSETSGSIANIVDQATLSATDNKDIIKLQNEMVSISVQALTPLAQSSNEVVSQLKKDIELGKISENDLKSMGIEINNLEITANSEKPVDNFLNILNVTNSLVNQKKASSELISKFDELKLITKKSLK